MSPQDDRAVKRQVTIEEILLAKERDMLIPGFAPPFSPEEADAAGAFEDDALADPDEAGRRRTDSADGEEAL
ncbi:MAG: hypothetical protein OXU20_22185 [Myxococcales bacterium]|nr:hypothetical protein [Myxococcales bacterium]